MIARLLPHLPASRRYWADRMVFRLWLATQAACAMAVRSQLLP